MPRRPDLQKNERIATARAFRKCRPASTVARGQSEEERFIFHFYWDDHTESGYLWGLEPDGDPDPDIPLLVGEDRFVVTDGHGFRAISVINHSPNLSGHG